ncbi:Arc/MetJ-type ribon-helix-helix transcriptional regulator [Methanococcus voltae]|uniref:Arc/MetJ-type ribon-helix-helix transcriptional regulator n=1 Tax=Methanococcus voltae TaxID=2188 RepID=A0A8J7S686_METVO|nr:DUF2683 family protein [Methanococcus voltae]MBP2202173.1 Arc/MetJ-type ribon-helix-helix transcriptional regulator [Methanococcus voltae]
MVKANITLDDSTNKIINLVKTTEEFKDKSETINYIILEYAEKILNNDTFKEEFIQSVLANRKSLPSENIDITSESSRRELLGL